MGFGVGIALTPMNLAAMNAVSNDHAGAASGILVTLSGLGATLGVAVTGAIFNGLLRGGHGRDGGRAGGDRTGRRSSSTGCSPARRARRDADQLAGDTRPGQTRRARRVRHALGTSLKLSAVLIAIGLVLTLVLMRNEPPIEGDADPRSVERLASDSGPA